MHSTSPPDWLVVWLDHVPSGRALDLGAGNGDLARWLAQHGFEVTAVEQKPAALADLRQLDPRAKVDVVAIDLVEFEPGIGSYSLILAAAVLHFLLPTDLSRLAPRLISALAPGGFLMAEVLTIDDPSFEERRATQDEIAANTFRQADRKEPIHYFGKGELRQLFAGLQILSYREDRRLSPAAQAGYRAGATLVARRPNH